MPGACWWTGALLSSSVPVPGAQLKCQCPVAELVPYFGARLKCQCPVVELISVSGVLVPEKTEFRREQMAVVCVRPTGCSVQCT